MVTIRPPTEAEFPAAQKILRDARLDPTTPLHFEHTLIAEANGHVVGVGQIKHYPTYQELGSLVVLPEFRGQGIAGQLIAALEARAARPLYLTCMAQMMPFYARFGYQQIGYQASPRNLQYKLLLTAVGRPFGFRVCVMRKD